MELVMRTQIIFAAGFSLLLLAACEKAENPEPPVPPAEDSTSAAPEGASGERAQDALGRAGEAARETMENLGQAGAAGIDALQENAPEIREGLNNAGERLRNAAGALTGEREGAPVDAEGDSQADANETPEAREPAR
jgi:hypothetical protein